MMTRTDFKKLAQVFADQVGEMSRSGLDTSETRLILGWLTDVAGDIADVCESSNDAFDREKFLAACGF